MPIIVAVLVAKEDDIFTVQRYIILTRSESFLSFSRSFSHYKLVAEVGSAGFSTIATTSAVFFSFG